jgi:hypothetical protein
LGGFVELTGEREKHIAAYHPELLPGHMDFLRETLEAPDQIRRVRRNPEARLFSKWYSGFKGGKHVVVVVVSHARNAGQRHWIVTAYVARRLARSEAEWKRN